MCVCYIHWFSCHLCREGSRLNRELLSISAVVRRLADPETVQYADYSQSKSVTLLHDVLGGNCVTLAIAHVKPSDPMLARATFDFSALLSQVHKLSPNVLVFVIVKMSLVCWKDVTGFTDHCFRCCSDFQFSNSQWWSSVWASATISVCPFEVFMGRILMSRTDMGYFVWNGAVLCARVCVLEFNWSNWTMSWALCGPWWVVAWPRPQSANQQLPCAHPADIVILVWNGCWFVTLCLFGFVFDQWVVAYRWAQESDSADRERSNSVDERKVSSYGKSCHSPWQTCAAHTNQDRAAGWTRQSKYSCLSLFCMSRPFVLM